MADAANPTTYVAKAGKFGLYERAMARKILKGDKTLLFEFRQVHYLMSLWRTPSTIDAMRVRVAELPRGPKITRPMVRSLKRDFEDMVADFRDFAFDEVREAEPELVQDEESVAIDAVIQVQPVYVSSHAVIARIRHEQEKAGEDVKKIWKIRQALATLWLSPATVAEMRERVDSSLFRGTDDDSVDEQVDEFLPLFEQLAATMIRINAVSEVPAAAV